MKLRKRPNGLSRFWSGKGAVVSPEIETGQ